MNDESDAVYACILMGDAMDKIRRHIIFYGRVQGVGFRWHCKNFANAKGLTGWVQNLPDGTVEMEVQGTEEKVSALIGYMEERPYVEIDRFDSEIIDLVNGDFGFYTKESW